MSCFPASTQWQLTYSDCSRHRMLGEHPNLLICFTRQPILTRLWTSLVRSYLGDSSPPPPIWQMKGERPKERKWLSQVPTAGLCDLPSDALPTSAQNRCAGPRTVLQNRMSLRHRHKNGFIIKALMGPYFVLSALFISQDFTRTGRHSNPDSVTCWRFLLTESAHRAKLTEHCRDSESWEEL